MVSVAGLFLLMLFPRAWGQEANLNPWNGKPMAVSLTYDDGLNIDLDNVVPILDSLGLKATFYVPCNSKPLGNRLEEWRAIAARGYELGNHSIFHPCMGKSKKRTWVQPEYDLDNYSLRKMIDEIRLANTFLRAIDGKSARTFAYTCGDMAIGDSSFVDSIRNDFPGARGTMAGMNLAGSTDLFDIRAFTVDGQKADELIDLVHRARKERAFVVFLFHGVGGEHPMNVALSEHNKLVRYLKEHEHEIWIPTMTEISAYIREQQQGRQGK